MPTMTRRRRGLPRFALDRYTIGNALVVFPKEKLTSEARSLAMSLPADPDNDVVVIDLPVDTPIAAWDSVADLLPRRRKGVRLVLGGRSRETTAFAGQWLSQRLRRTVLAPDGMVVHGAAGALFVHSGRGSGWVRFEPGRPPAWEAKRFPRPSWDDEAVRSFPTSSTGMAEPIPGGVWLRPVTGDVRPQPHFARLAAQMPCQPDVLAVVLGCPGAPPLSLDDVIRCWCSLSGPAREQARFVQYGPVRLPEGEALGQVLADTLGETIRCCPGLPVGSPADPGVVTVRSDGGNGWPVSFRALEYTPTGRVPALLDVRVPVEGPPELAPGVYWYAPDAAVEVVQSGLWVRPHADVRGAEQVRARLLDPEVQLMVFDTTDARSAPRMRMLAQDLLDRLDPAVRARSRLVATADLAGPARVTGRAGGELDTGTGDAVTAAGALASAPADAPERTIALENGGTVALAWSEQPTVAGPCVDVLGVDVPAEVAAPPEGAAPAGMVAPPEVPVPGQAESASLPEVATGPEVTLSEAAAPPVAAVIAPAPEAATPAGPAVADQLTPIGLRLEGAPLPSDVDEPAARPGRDTPPAPAAAAPPERATPAAVQPTPAAEATALLSGKGIEQERAWLRRTLSREFDTMANSIARILSEHPGFQSGDSRTSDDVLTDTVAVRLYLSAKGAEVDRALRTGVNGPHVPFARCVVSGLTRLPSHRGATVFAASPTEEQWQLYQKRRLVTEWGFVHSLTQPSADQGGAVDVLVWSMTARRARLLEPDGDEHTDNRVVFVPGTSFKVLDLAAPTTGERGRLFLRELAPSEIDDTGRVAADRVSLDELAMTSLRRCVEHWADAEPAGLVGPAARPRFGALPGLVEQVEQVARR
jgi:hypothetical protein